MNIEELIKLYDMQPHPEGGFFKESYRAVGKTSTASGDRNFSTAIYFLLPEGQKSSLHRLSADEVWHFYLGGPMDIFEISPEGKFSRVTLGPDPKAAHKFQHVVPAGTWFGGTPHKDSGYSFVGCTVSPGFDFVDFEMGDRDRLVRLCPEEEKIIDLLMA
jgi:predicted cupin superfamily sugar epimerase